MKNKRKKKYKFKWHNTITILVIAICISTLLYSLTNIILWHYDNRKTEEQINNIIENTKIIEIQYQNPDINSNQEELKNDEINKNTDYWNYMNIDLIHVDFNELKAINNDVKGWVKLNGTNINYPFVQTNDNKYYLTHSFNKTYNQAGWVFMDYRNNINDLNRNTILYAY